MAGSLLFARDHKKSKQDYGQGFSAEISASEDEVLDAVSTVVNDGIIQGSKEYNKDPYIDKAEPASASPLFPAWTGSGKVFFKVRKQVLDPRGFYDSNDIGTLAVRYVVQSSGPAKTILRIDAVFVEDFRRISHASDGNVESAEYKDIQDHVDATQAQKRQAEEDEKRRQQEIAKRVLQTKSAEEEASALTRAQVSAETLEQHVEQLRHQLERVIKAPGAHLKSAPMSSATNLKSLDAGAEVVILIDTVYWYGIETEDGQHGWVKKSELEPLP